MEGIIILNQTEIMTEPSWFGPVLLIGFFSTLIIVAVIVGWLNRFKGDGAGIAGGLIGSILYAIIFLIVCFQSVPSGRYRYETIIEESMRFDEVLDKYNVIEQKGKIWILEDKEMEND